MFSGEISLTEAYDLLENYSHNPKSSCYVSKDSKSVKDYDLTVIVPTYNNASFLKRCLDSIINQKSQYKVQVIIINDGSTDNTVELLQFYDEMPGVTIINQPNKGLGGARNTGLDISKGKYIAFVDAGDRLADGAIQKMLSTALAYDADVVAGNFIYVYENGKLKKENKRHRDEQIKAQGNLAGFAWGKIYKAYLFDHLRFPEGYWFEDSVMAQIIWPMANNVHTISDIVYEYTVNSKCITATSRSSEKAVDSLYITEQLLKDKKLFGLQLAKAEFEYFLSMVRLTYQRNRLCSGEIAKAIFVVQCELYKQFFGLKSDNNLDLQKTLAECNYVKYVNIVSK